MGKFIGAILIIAIIAIVIFLGFTKWGWGKGSGDGDGSVNSSSVSDTNDESDDKIKETEESITTASQETTVTTEPTEPTTVDKKSTECIEVTVSGNIYLYNNKSSTIEEIIAAALSEKDIKVEITDDLAIYNTMKALTDELDEENIEWYIVN